MRKGWTTKTLSEACKIRPPKNEVRDIVSADGLVSFLPMEDLGIDEKFVRATQTKPLSAVVGSYTYFANGDVLLAKITPCFENGKLGIAEGLTNGIGFGSSEYIVFRPNGTLSKEWLYYYLSRELFRAEGAARMSGAVGHKRVAKEFIEGYPIPIPPLPEQQRIVGILDEAFDSIVTAKANAEKNLQNARALFESHLQSVFTQRGEGRVERKLSEVCAITSTLVDPRKDQFRDLIHVGAGNIESQTGVFVGLKTAHEEGLISGKFLFDDSMVLYSKIRPYLMKAARPDFSGLCSADMYPLAPMPNQIIRDYLFHLLLSKPFTEYAIQGSARAGMPKVNREHLFEFRVWLPAVKKQKELAEKLDSLHEETQRLEFLYQRKLTALDELKKSLLHQAFTGQLTAGQSIQVRSTVIPFPVTLPNITTTDLHAGVLAMAFEQHQKNGKETFFTHVKAEKIAHMVEAHLGLDLGRAPVKDAAGPNDFPHLIRVEHRARKANYFDFKQIGTTYRVRKLRGFERLIDKTRIVLGDRHKEVEPLLQWMLPMTVEQAEIVATVFAAWNNLLLDGMRPTDEQIVFEARENWHPDKLKIKRHRFFAAVQWLRKQGRVPEGKGRRVADKRN